MQNLTPIKIPGKRGCTKKSSLVSNRNKIQGEGRFPRCSSARSGERTKSQKSLGRQSLHGVEEVQDLSPLEKLPTELLQTIFTDCLNVNFLRASPVIAVKLGSQHNFIQAILEAFGPTWRYRYNHVRGNGDYDVGNVPGDAVTQSTILNAGWATLPLLREAERLWLSHEAQKNALLCQDLYFPNPQPVGRWYNESEDNFFDKDYIDFRALAGKTRGSDNAWRWDGFLTLHPNTAIPDRLLKGPWSEDLVRHLFWFLRAGARIRSLSTVSGEVGARVHFSPVTLRGLFILTIVLGS